MNDFHDWTSSAEIFEALLITTNEVSRQLLYDVSNNNILRKLTDFRAEAVFLAELFNMLSDDLTEDDLQYYFTKFIHFYEVAKEEWEQQAYKELVNTIGWTSTKFKLPLKKNLEYKSKETVTILEPKKKAYGTIEVNIEGSNIIVKYRYDEKFISAVKSLKFQWNAGMKIWTKKSKDVINHTAELVNKLLDERFAVEVYDEEVIKKVQEGDIEPENFKKISFLGDTFRISWNGRNDKIYTSALELPEAKYEDKEVKVHKRYVNEVLEYGRINNFIFTEQAKRQFEALRIEKILVHPVTKAELSKLELDDILKSSTAVLEDLKDD